jgi:murein DD-endopeptidase MepM/ murein hydrolase activator NlpD
MARSLRLRLFGGKKLTFLYVPDNSSVRQFMVPRVVFYALGIGALLTLGLIGFFGSRYLSAAAEGRETLRLRGENIQLRDQLMQMQQQLASLQVEMKSSVDVQQRLRLVASLQELDQDVLRAGIGGPSPSLSATQGLSPEVRRGVEDASAQLSQLLRQAQVQRESYSEILTALQDKRETWDHTPSVRPLTFGTITSQYGRRMDPFTGQTAMHKGVDFAARPGSPIRATADGVVTAATTCAGYGLMVEIDHGDGLHSRYAHCMAALVKPGDRVKRGEIIARVGSSGRSSGSHCHYEILRNGLQLDPMNFVLPGDVVVD